MNRLDTSNSNHYSFATSELKFHVLGGLNIYSLDKLRVTIKVHTLEDEYQALRHNIDLYNSNAVEKLVRQIAEFLKVRMTGIRKGIFELIHLLEKYRLELLEFGDSDEVEEYSLSEDEESQAKELLLSENLLEKTNTLIGVSGVIGEEVNRLLMYLIFTSRKTENPLNCISFGSSGVGKTHLQSKVSDLIPEEDKVEITVLSANAFYYFKRNELKNKLILIEDMDGADEVLYPLRELQTKKRITKSVVQKGVGGQGKTKSLVVEGPVSVGGCTTHESLYEDNANRSFLLYIDESEQQDERIMAYQRAESAGRVNKDDQAYAMRLLQNSQRLLSPIAIRNPFAESLILPKSVFKPRRTNAHYLQFIEAITFYCQWQREKLYDERTGEEYIETTLEDIKTANDLIKDVLLRKSDPLNGATRNYLERLKKHLSHKQDALFTNQEVRRELRIAESTLRRYHTVLLEEGYIRKRTDINAESFTYEIVDVEEFKQLEVAIDKALSLCIATMEEQEAKA